MFKETLKKISKSPAGTLGRYWHTLGPGLTTGAADDDPSGIATYSQTGARFGFQFLWVALFSFPLMAVVQEMCARIGMVTGRGLAANIRTHHARWVLYLCTILLFGANVFNIGADLGAMAQATRLLVPQLPFGALVVGFMLFSLSLQIFVTYGRYARYLKYLSLSLVAYIITAIAIDLPWLDILTQTLMPQMSFSSDQIFLLCAIFGTTISPYLFFWQTSQEVEEEILLGRKTVLQRQEKTFPSEIAKMRTDVWSGMFFSNMIMFFIIAVCAATLFAEGVNDIRTAADAAAALYPLAGAGASLLFAFGIVGTGLLAVPVLAASASYALAESFGWRNGLYRPWRQAHAFYGVMIAAMVLGLVMNFIGLDPIRALIYSAILNGIVSPLMIAIIVRLSSNKRIMGDWANSRVVSAAGWLIFGVMGATGLATLLVLVL